MNEPDVQTTSAAATEDEPRRDYFRVIIRAPVHKVWAELTRCDSVLPFFFNSRCKTPGLEPGAPIRMLSKDGKYAAVVGEVLEFDPPHRYAHTFKFTSQDDPICTIRYELKEVADGTEFTLINENVPAGTKSEKYMTSGAHFITRNLKAIVETGKPTTSGKLQLFLMGLFGPLTPARCRSENWPFERKI